MSNETRAFVEYDPAYLGIKIAIRRPGDAAIFVDFEDAPNGRPSTKRNMDNEVEFEIPWLRLWDDDAKALYEALAHHFGGHPETVSLRRDYEAERARVDKMIDGLLVLQTGAVANGTEFLRRVPS